MRSFFRDILQERDADNIYRFSWSRVQSFISFFYFLVFYTKQTWNTGTIPDVPEGWIFLIGVSSATYLVAKYAARMNGIGYSTGPVYNSPHAPSGIDYQETTIVPGPDGPSTLSVKKNDLN